MALLWINGAYFAAGPLHVVLPTQEQASNATLALYLAPLIQTEKSLYMDELMEVLSFDFKHAGSLRILPSDQELDRVLALPLTQERIAKLKMRLGKHCVVIPNWMAGKLVIELLDLSDPKGVESYPVSLSFRLEEDVKAMRIVFDKMVEKLTGIEGIASKPIFYSLQKDPNQFVSVIYQSDYDGRFPKAVSAEDDYAICPCSYQVDGKRGALFVSYKEGIPKIMMSDFHGGWKPVVQLRGNQLLPAISSRHHQIAFISDVTGHADLFLQSFDPYQGGIGKPYQIFAAKSGVAASPAFSPDGSKIAFVSDHSGRPSIYLLNLSGYLSTKRAGAPQQIVRHEGEASCPRFSPDGKKLAYSAKTEGLFQIWVYDFETKQQMQVTYGPYDKENPTWAKDNFHLIYNSTTPSYQLYLTDLISHKQELILSGEGRYHYPFWAS